MPAKKPANRRYTALPPLEEVEMRVIPQIDRRDTYCDWYIVYWRGRPLPLRKGAFHGKARASTTLNQFFEHELCVMFPSPRYGTDERTVFDQEIKFMARELVARLKASGILTIERMRAPGDASQT